MSKGPTATGLLSAHEHSSKVAQSNLERRIIALETVVAQLLQGISFDWEMSETYRDSPIYRANGYRILRWGAGWLLRGNGLEVESANLVQLKRQAQNHYCIAAAAKAIYERH